MNTTYILIGAAVLLAIYVIGSYNSFVVLVARLKEALSGIDVQLKRRADLIPNLVETVKGTRSTRNLYSRTSPKRALH